MKINTEDLNKKILVDSDVIRHFIKGNSIEKLPKIFPGNLYIIDLVEHEICRSIAIKPIVLDLIENKGLKRMRFPAGKKAIRDEYASLVADKMGTGESACMAVAKYSDDIIASNNLKDIKSYCIENSILYLNTLDILCIAYYKNVMTKGEIDYFLYLNLHAKIKSRIPYENLDAYLKTNPAISTIFKKTA